MIGNVIVGQSGGPTAVINSSLVGVFKTAKDRGAAKVYGMVHGIQGLLEERYVDLDEHIRSDLDIELLKRTPSAYLGSCRYKLPEIGENDELFQRALYASNVNLMSRASLDEPVRLTAKIRYAHKAAPCIARQLPDGSLYVCFDEPQRAITPGQAVVLYDGDLVAGGGIIEKIAPELDDAS